MSEDELAMGRGVSRSLTHINSGETDSKALD